MNDEDLRDLFAGLALMGLIAEGQIFRDDFKGAARRAYQLSDAMIEAKYADLEEPEVGITAIKPKRKPRSTT
jgi:hypothetical protein